MTSKWLFILQEHSKQLWFRASLYCLLALVAALLGIAVDRTMGDSLPTFIERDAVRQILEILASSMLIVATFALTVMVAAIRAAANTATPRATQLLTEDSSAQNALAAFIGAFLFSILGLIAANAQVYGEGGIVVLFGATILVVLLVVVMLLRWVDQLTRIGRVEISIDLVEDATHDALAKRARMPLLGGQWLTEVPAHAVPVDTSAIGYVQYIDVEMLQHIAARHDIQIYVDALPGRFCDLVRHIAYTDKPVAPDVMADISEALVIGGSRTFPQDPRFGFIVLGEIAIRALSPAMNDPGTAIDVVGTSVRLFQTWAAECCRQATISQVLYDRVWVRELREEDFFEDLYSAIVRDGAGFAEVCIRLQKALRAIGHLGYAPYDAPARLWSARLLERCRGKLTKEEFAQVKRICDSWERAADD